MRSSAWRAVRPLVTILAGIGFFVPLLFPLYWIVVSSFQNLTTIYASAPSLMPTHIYGPNYSTAFSSLLPNIG